jgi:hypothetical protein
MLDLGDQFVQPEGIGLISCNSRSMSHEHKHFSAKFRLRIGFGADIV